MKCVSKPTPAKETLPITDDERAFAVLPLQLPHRNDDGSALSEKACNFERVRTSKDLIMHQSEEARDGDDVEEEAFNLESCPETEELELSLRSEAIGNTLYDKQFVLTMIMEICQRQNTSNAATTYPDEDQRKKLEALTEMTLEPDVCQFLFTSGCLDILVQETAQMDCITLINATLAILLNCFHCEDEALKTTISDSKHLQLVMLMVLSLDSVEALTSSLNLLTRVCQFTEGSIITRFMDTNFVERLQFLLVASSNDRLLEGIAKFLFTLIDTILECEDESPNLALLQTQSFTSALMEAFKQCQGKPVSTFNLVEVLAITVSSENVVGIHQDLCDLVHDYLEKSRNEDLCISTLIGLSKICTACYNLEIHQSSLQSLVSVVARKMKQSKALGDENNIEALKNILDQMETFTDDNK